MSSGGDVPEPAATDNTDANTDADANSDANVNVNANGNANDGDDPESPKGEWSVINLDESPNGDDATSDSAKADGDSNLQQVFPEQEQEQEQEGESERVMAPNPEESASCSARNTLDWLTTIMTLGMRRSKNGDSLYVGVGWMDRWMDGWMDG